MIITCGTDNSPCNHVPGTQQVRVGLVSIAGAVQHVQQYQRPPRPPLTWVPRHHTLHISEND